MDNHGSAKFVKPCLKWVGGKTQILSDVMALFPKEMQNYHEPFLGGGSVLLALLSLRQQGVLRVSGTIYASDLNPHLIAFYRNVQSDPEGLIAEVTRLADEMARCANTGVNRQASTLEEALTSSESYYYWLRSRFNQMSAQAPSLTHSAMLLCLNKTCFRGVYREGPHGFNVPFGHYKHSRLLDADHIRTMSALLQGVVFAHASFEVSLSRVAPGDFVYLDPPYAPVNDTSFVSYTSDGFGLDHHRRLFGLCREWKEKKVMMLLSNADVPLVQEAFPSPLFATRVVKCRRTIHCKQSAAARTNEVLITNCPLG